MNKKVIALIVGILVIVGIAVTFVVMNGKSNENNQESNNNQTQTGSNTNENNNSNDNTDNNENQGDENMNNNSGKTLVLYFSMSGNTETVAQFIHDKVGGDIVKLETVQTYPSDYNTLVDYAQEEQRKNERPELKTKINIDDYDTIFLGYPNWWGDMPMPLYTLLDEYDFSGKTIAPFITHGGSGLSGTPAKIKNEESNATVTEGLAVRDSNAKSSQSTVNDWLSKIGY